MTTLVCTKGDTGERQPFVRESRAVIARLRRLSSAAVACLVMAACVPDGAPTTTGAPRSAEPLANATPVSAARAKAMFDAVCGASLPNFDAAPKLMAAQGFTRSSPMGTATIYSRTENASFQIKDGPGLGKTCSMVVATKDAPATVKASVRGTKIFQTMGSDAALYNGGKALILHQPPQKSDGLTYMNFQMLSER